MTFRLKLFKIGMYDLWATAIIILATLLRILLISQGWPGTDSDESTMGLMALHIVKRGEQPIFFYGQHYMGSLEAYLGAALFHLFGPSTFAVRLGLVFLFLLFLVSMYLLASLLYSKQLALATLILLSLGSASLLQRELDAIGGYPETILFGTLAFLLALWLALSSQEERAKRSRAWRLLAYGGWGLAVGLGIWSNLLILPFVLAAGLLLALFCWRDLWSLAPVCLVLGFVLGAFPFLAYNLTAAHGQDTFSAVFGIHREGLNLLKNVHYPIINQMRGAFLISLPTATGVNPACDGATLKVTGVLHASTFFCSARYMIWSLGYILLWGSAVALAAIATWRLWRRSSKQARTYEERQTLIRQCTSLLLLGSAGLAFVLFVLSPAPAVWPVTSARYLFGLLIVTPAVLSPLWNGGGGVIKPLSARLAKWTIGLRGAILFLIGMAFLLGTVLTLGMIPGIQTVDQRQETLVHDMLHAGITRMYSDYWTCDRIIFQSNEQIICSVIDGQLQQGYDRYIDYRSIVKADPQAAYVLHMGSQEATTFAQKMLTQPGQHYQHFVLDGYEIYRPTQ